MRKYKTLQDWVSDALSDQDKDGGCTAISCLYKKHEGGTREIHTVKLTGRTWEPEKLAELFRGKAETFAQDLGGVQRFELVAFYGNRSEPQAAHPFTVVDGEVKADGHTRGVRESPDAQGIAAQSMRHTERAYDQLNQFASTFGVQMLQAQERLYTRIATLEKEVFDSYGIIRDMMMKQIELDHAKRMEMLQYERSTREREMFFKMAPALANTISGRELFPQNAADTAIIESIAEYIEPEKIQMLVGMGVIPQTAAAAVVTRITEIRRQREAEKQALRNLPPSNSDPAKDATGGNGQHNSAMEKVS